MPFIHLKFGDSRRSPCRIDFEGMKFLITERPTNYTMQNYIQILQAHNVRDLVRVCEPTYATNILHAAGIRVTDLFFEDGQPPTPEAVEEWFQILRNNFVDDSDLCVAVHCSAGLGRAPVLVAIALIESGMNYEDAVDYIRKRRRGAINAKQLEYLGKYRPKKRLQQCKNTLCTCSIC